MKLDNKVKNSPFRKPIGVVSLCSHRGWSVHAPARGGRTRRSLPSPSAHEARAPALRARPAPAGVAQRSCPHEEARAMGHTGSARGRNGAPAPLPQPATADAAQRLRPREGARGARAREGTARRRDRAREARLLPLRHRRALAQQELGFSGRGIQAGLASGRGGGWALGG